ncbi:MAG TPA: class I SAM-dependent methyltransferase, partial [Deltaproteobacteria bacterium]|nr:class I SAM-dependent methyltransferase [Deltaproteobacteria bacterium]
MNGNMKESNSEDLKITQKTWEYWGEKDPLWGVISSESKKHNKWDVDSFLKTGRDEIQFIRKFVEENSLDFPNEKAMDFGCGPARLSIALSPFFQEIHGVDISKPMLDKGKELINYSGIENIQLHLNTEDNLKLFSDGFFDFVYSSITLQHINKKDA